MSHYHADQNGATRPKQVLNHEICFLMDGTLSFDCMTIDEEVKSRFC